MSLAVFDVDGTLVTGPSTERRFFRWLVKRGHIGPRQLFCFALFLGRWAPDLGVDVARRNKAYLSGLDTATVAAEAVDFVAAEVVAALNRDCVAELERARARGDRVTLLTGTIEPIAAALAAHLGVAEYVATRCAIDGGLYTASPPLRHPFGTTKLALARQHFADDATLRTDAAAYGDSIHDAELLRAVARPVCVNPDDKLAALAAENGWRVMRS